MTDPVSPPLQLAGSSSAPVTPSRVSKLLSENAHLRSQLSELVTLVHTLQEQLPIFERLKSRGELLAAEAVELREANARLSAGAVPSDSLSLLAADLSAERTKNTQLVGEIGRLQGHLDRVLAHNKRLIEAFADPCARVPIPPPQDDDADALQDGESA
jgi:hypothetical protein